MNLIKIDFVQLFLDSVKKHESYLLELNREQLSKKKRSDNSRITPEYKPSNKKKGNPNLFITGAYYKSYEVKLNRLFVNIGSEHKVKDFNLGEHLRERYGDKIEGLTDKNRDKFLRLAFAELEKKINDAYSRL